MQRIEGTETDANPVAMATPSLRSGLFVPVSLGLLLSAIILGPFMLAGHAPGDLGDTRFNIFVLEHVYQFVTGHIQDFASPGIFYPFPDTLFFSDTHVGSAVVYILFRDLGFAELNAFSLWFFIGCLTTYVAAYYALVQFGLKPLPAAVAAAIFAFGLPSLAQFARAQLVYRCGVPLAMLYLWRSLHVGSAAALVAAALWLLVQILIGIYLGTFLGFLMLGFAAAFLIFEGRGSGRRWTGRLLGDLRRRAASPRAGDIALLLAFAAALVATGWLLFEYVQVARLYGLHRDWQKISIMLPRPSSYLIMDGLPYWHRLVSFVGDVPMRWEHQMFVGLGVLGLFAAGVWRLMFAWSSAEERALSRAMLAALVVIVLLTLIVGDSFSLYRLIANVPGVNAIRAVTRIIVVLLFPIAYIAGTGLTMLFYECRPRTVGVGVGLVLTFIAAYEMGAVAKSHFSIEDAERRIDVIMQQAKAQAKQIDRPVLAVVSASEPGDPPYVIQLDAMLAAQRLGWPTVNGFSGNFVPAYTLQPRCGMAAAQYLAFEAWQRARKEPLQEFRLGHDAANNLCQPSRLQHHSLRSARASFIRSVIFNADNHRLASGNSRRFSRSEISRRYQTRRLFQFEPTCRAGELFPTWIRCLR